MTGSNRECALSISDNTGLFSCSLILQLTSVIISSQMVLVMHTFLPTWLAATLWDVTDAVWLSSMRGLELARSIYTTATVTVFLSFERLRSAQLDQIRILSVKCGNTALFRACYNGLRQEILYKAAKRSLYESTVFLSMLAFSPDSIADPVLWQRSTDSTYY